MKFTIAAVLVLGSTLATSAAFAQQMNADDLKWINKCISDNKGEPGATPEITRKYCICMNEKMENNETQSITAWEKTHPAEQAACSKAAGWK